MPKELYKINVLNIYKETNKKCWEKCNDSFKYETKPLSGGKWLFEWLSHLVLQQIPPNGCFIQKRGKWLLSLWTVTEIHVQKLIYFNFLFIELLLYKNTLQLCWKIGHAMMHT